MNWFRQNRALGILLIAFSLLTIAALLFLWHARSRFAEARARFDENATELTRLQQLAPFPSEVNLQKMKAQAQDYGAELTKLKADLQKCMLPAEPMAPNEFQTRLRQAVNSLADKAKANKVKLPDNFFLGFEEFAAALPDTAAAPSLGQELAQVELLLNLLIDARVDAINSLRRVPRAEWSPAVAAPVPSAKNKPAASAPLVERNVIDLTFAGSPSAVRKAINQSATNEQQLYIMRTLHVLNEQEKGPPREGANPAGTAPTPAPVATGALNFIVGNEHIQTSARVEMLRFTF